jgi:hypothetical protein
MRANSKSRVGATGQWDPVHRCNVSLAPLSSYGPRLEIPVSQADAIQRFLIVVSQFAPDTLPQVKSISEAPQVFRGRVQAAAKSRTGMVQDCEDFRKIMLWLRRSPYRFGASRQEINWQYPND